MSTYSAGAGGESDSSVLLKLFALFAGITVPVVMIIGLFLAISAHNARDDARKAVATVSKASGSATSTMPGMSMPGMTMPSAGSTAHGAVPSPSFAGVAPDNADALAT